MGSVCDARLLVGPLKPNVGILPFPRQHDPFVVAALQNQTIRRRKGVDVLDTFGPFNDGNSYKEAIEIGFAERPVSWIVACGSPRSRYNLFLKRRESRFEISPTPNDTAVPFDRDEYGMRSGMSRYLWERFPEDFR